MGVNPDLLVVRKVAELNEAGTFDPGDLLFAGADGILKRMSTESFYPIFNNIARPIDPADAGPFTANRWYKPTTSSVDPGTNYPNAGSLKARKNYDTLFWYDGANWIKTEVEIGGVTVASSFVPTNSIDAQGAKQINDYYIGKQEDFTTKLQNQIVNNSWVIVSFSGYNTTVIDVAAGDRITITGLDGTNTDFSAGLKPTGQNVKILMSKFSNNFSFIVPSGFEKFNFTSNGAQNWKVVKNNTGVLTKVPDYTIIEKSVAWSDGTWNDNGVETALSGYRKTTMNRVPSKIKLSGFTTSEKYLKLFNSSNLKNFEIQPFVNDTVYDLTGYYNYAVVLNGSETGGKIYEYSEVKNTNNGINVLNVLNEGAKGDGVTDDTTSINAAIVKLKEMGGGTLFFPAGVYVVTQIVIPDLGTDWISINLEGEFPPSYKIGSVNPINMTYTAYDITKGRGTVIKSSATTGSGVIFAQSGSGYLSFNLGLLSLKNLIIRTYDNPRISGVHAKNIAQLSVDNCVVDTGVYCVVAAQPTYEAVGLIVPNHSNAGMITLNRVSISGYKYGLSIYEHTVGENLFIAACVHGLYFNYSDLPSLFSKVTVHICTNAVTISDTCRFDIAQLAVEYAAASQMPDPSQQWHATDLELNDPLNKGKGRIIYSNNKGTVGAVETWRVSGGSNVYVYSISNPTARITTTIPSP